MTNYSRNTDRECYECGHDTRLIGEQFMLTNRLWARVCWRPVTDTMPGSRGSPAADC